MRKCIIAFALLFVLAISVSAQEFTAPTAPSSAQSYMPDEEESFGEGLWYIIKTAIADLRPELIGTCKICLSLIAAVLLLGLVCTLTNRSDVVTRLTGAVIVGVLLLEPLHSMIRLSTETVVELCEYSKLLVPVMTASLAAQGGTATATALYTATVFLNTILTTAVSRLLVPALYVYLCLCVANSAMEQDMLKKLKDFIKWAMTWGLKLVLYIFTGYITVTGVISGAVDASALKAVKLTISGVVPVVGGILSDATETILVSAGLMKNAAGVYGIFAVLAICIGPFLQIGIQYLLLKLSGTVCGLIGTKSNVDLINDFSAGMGIVLAMAGTVCVLLLISLVCFMRGLNG